MCPPDGTPFAEPLFQDWFDWMSAPTKKKVTPTCPRGRVPSFEGPKQNWYQPIPGFWLPACQPWDVGRWPDYTSQSYVRALMGTPDLMTMIVAGPVDKQTRMAWGAYFGALGCDGQIRFVWPQLGEVLDRTYQTARYKHLVPAWRRAIISVLTELDDVEDQLSTILWIAEWVTKKVIPLPPMLMNKTQQLQNTLDTAEETLAGITLFRINKPLWIAALREKQARLASAKKRRAGLLGWFGDNWGRLLEAGQATGTWFDVGIILGPIFAFLEEGMYGLAYNTLDNYLVATDALVPGYRQDFYRNAEELSNKVSRAWDETWENLREWDQESIEEQMPGFFAP